MQCPISHKMWSLSQISMSMATEQNALTETTRNKQETAYNEQEITYNDLQQTDSNFMEPLHLKNKKLEGSNISKKN